MTKFLSVAFLLLSFALNSAQAQKVKLKKDKVVVDGVVVMDYKFGNHKTELTLFESGTDTEVAFIRWDFGGTVNYNGDDYTSFQFPQADLVLETRRVAGFPAKVKWLFENKVISDGKLNLDKIDAFVKRYDEKITERTVIIK